MKLPRIFVLALAALLWILVLWLGARCVSSAKSLFSQPSQTGLAVESAFIPPVVAEALAIDYKPHTPAIYTGGDTPFRLQSGQTPKSGAAPAYDPTIPLEDLKLKLKGVLIKESPQAIIEDETGKTFLCGEGDTIGAVRVEKINGDRVKVRIKNRTVDLTVPE